MRQLTLFSPYSYREGWLDINGRVRPFLTQLDFYQAAKKGCDGSSKAIPLPILQPLQVRGSGGQKEVHPRLSPVS